MKKNIGNKGIIACLYGPKRWLVKPGDRMYIQLSDVHRFFLDANEPALFGKDTQDIKSTIKEAKWAFILNTLWEVAAQTGKGEEYTEWMVQGINKEEGKVDFAGIQGRYKKGEEQYLWPSDKDNFWIGYDYRMEVFNYFPGKGLYFYFMIVTQPKIRFAYFDKQLLPGTTVNNGQLLDRFYNYGEYVPLHISTHLLPMHEIPRNNLNITYEPLTNNLELRVWLTDGEQDLLEDPVEQGPLRKYIESTSGANVTLKVMVLIDPKWKTNFHNKAEVLKWYSVRIVIENLDTKNKYHCNREKLTESFKIVNHETGNVEVKVVQNGFSVKYQSTAMILEEFEKIKTQQIQYIGDIEYQVKEFDPCGFKRIKIIENDRKLYLFDEDKEHTTKIDETAGSFAIIAGDSPKEVYILLEELQDANSHLCTGVLLPDGEKHNSWDKIFQMGTVLSASSSKENSHNKIALYQEKDQDSDPLKSTEVILDSALAQQLVLGENYFQAGDNGIKLLLAYKYNKTYDNKILDYLAIDQKWIKYGQWGDALANIWVLRYLLLLIKGKKLHQTYYVPISTCRYPNQIVKIHLFPDMKWVINFNYNIKEPLYYNESPTQLEYYDRRENEFDDLSGNIKRAELVSLKKRIGSAYHNQKSGFALSVDCEVNGKSTIHLSKIFAEKYKKNFKIIFDILDFLDDKLGVSVAKKEDEKQSKENINYNKRKGLRDLPVSFELMPPSLGIGVGIGYAPTAQNIMGWGLEGRIIANPLIGAKVRLDLLALGSKIKPWGAILDALDLAVWAAESLSNGRLEVDYKIEIVFESQINLVGKKIGEDPKTKEPIYEKYGNIKYNFTDGGTIGDFNVQGIIKGRIEMSAKIRWKTKIGKYNTLGEAEIAIGIKGESAVTITIPTKLDSFGYLTLEFVFSGVIFNAWFKISASIKNDSDEKEDKKPDISKKIIERISYNHSIKL